MPAYVRRYPYLLARLDQNARGAVALLRSDSGLIGEIGDGDRLCSTARSRPRRSTRILKFCEDFEIAAQRTSAFVKEMQEMDLLIDGEVTIQPDGADQPFLYRGFRMIDEEKLRDMNGDQLRKINQNGILRADHGPPLLAVARSASCSRRQVQLGKVPEQLANATPEGNA